MSDKKVAKKKVIKIEIHIKLNFKKLFPKPFFLKNNISLTKIDFKYRYLSQPAMIYRFIFHNIYLSNYNKFKTVNLTAIVSTNCLIYKI